MRYTTIMRLLPIQSLVVLNFEMVFHVHAESPSNLVTFLIYIRKTHVKYLV